jgi:hypothetical protein
MERPPVRSSQGASAAVQRTPLSAPRRALGEERNGGRSDLPKGSGGAFAHEPVGVVLTLRTRAGKIARVDASEALRRKQTGVLVPGYAYTAQGTYDPTGALRAQAVARAKDSAAIWPLDR